MNIDVSGIIAAKLAQMDQDGTIQRKIEETLEKTILSAISDELGSYSLKRSIADQVEKCVGTVAADCGFSAYNGFIAERVKAILEDLYTADISEKVQAALNDVLLQKYENIKLSDIFARYREWVLAYTDEEDKYEREHYTAQLIVRKDGPFAHYKIRFADQPLSDCDDADVAFRFCTYGDESTAKINDLCFGGHDMSKTLRVGTLTTFEAFVANLYFNGTDIILDDDEVDDSDYFDIDI